MGDSHSSVSSETLISNKHTEAHKKIFTDTNKECQHIKRICNKHEGLKELLMKLKIIELQTFKRVTYSPRCCHSKCTQTAPKSFPPSDAFTCPKHLNEMYQMFEKDQSIQSQIRMIHQNGTKTEQKAIEAVYESFTCVGHSLCNGSINIVTKQPKHYWPLLMRCHFFYRGFYIRWISYLIYSWFNSLMVLQLMDSVCLSDGQLKSKLCQMHRIKFIGCDMVIVIYCIMVLGIWNRLQYVDAEQLKQYKLSVKSHGVKELFVFIGILVLCNVMCDTFFTKLVVKKMLLPFTVVVILVSNFLMR
eukprot:156020_1